MSVDPNQNPYAVGGVQPRPVESSVEAFRRKHLSHEASVKSIALLYSIGAVVGFLSGIGMLMESIAALNESNPTVVANAVTILAISSLVLFISLAQIILAFGLRRLKSWAKIPTIVLSTIGLVLIPIGTLVNGYILYLVISERGKVVFSDEYKEVIRQTPHIKYRTSIVVWIFLALLLLLIGFGMVIAYQTSEFNVSK